MMRGEMDKSIEQKALERVARLQPLNDFEVQRFGVKRPSRNNTQPAHSAGKPVPKIEDKCVEMGLREFGVEQTLQPAQAGSFVRHANILNKRTALDVGVAAAVKAGKAGAR
jgi:hypothetical protein